MSSPKNYVLFKTEISESDWRELVQSMRPLDRREVLDETSNDDAMLYAVLMDGYAHSTHCATFFVNGELCGIVGMRPINLALGVYMPWMLTTNAFERHKLSLTRVAKKVIAKFEEDAKELRVAVPAFYKQAVDFLKYLGFSVSEPINRFGRVFYLCQKKVEG